MLLLGSMVGDGGVITIVCGALPPDPCNTESLSLSLMLYVLSVVYFLFSVSPPVLYRSRFTSVSVVLSSCVIPAKIDGPDEIKSSLVVPFFASGGELTRGLFRLPVAPFSFICPTPIDGEAVESSEVECLLRLPSAAGELGSL